MACKMTFQVLCPMIESGEKEAVMCVTGSCEELGEWDAKKVVRMTANEAEDTNRRIWKTDVNLPKDSEITYRYALCSFHKLTSGSVEEKVIVHRWETNIVPRVLVTEGATLCKEEEVFGNYDEQENTDTGWLIEQTEMMILIHGQPLSLQGHSSEEVPPFSVKVTARQERAMTPDEENTSKKHKKVYDILPVFIRVLNQDECEPRLHQHTYGRHFHKDDVMIFSVQTLKPDTMSFKVEMFSQDIGDGDTVENLGVATILGRNVICAPRCVPLIDQDMDNVGTLEMTCCIIKPLQPTSVCNFESSFSKHWNDSRGCVEIGHRGMGRSLVDKSLLVNAPTNTNIPENTVKSLQQAMKHGADFVEFDIHITKDRVPVIGHDFQAALTPSDVLGTSNADTSHLYLEVPINYLNLSEIDSLKTGKCMVLEHTDKKPSPCSSPTRAPIPKEMQLFPTLQLALEECDIDLGFLIEVKYPMDRLEGSKEMPHEKHPLERNALTDAIINIIMKYGGQRRIVFCAFDPYVCIMLRRKQNKYPVLYANFGPSERYQLYAGPLCTGIPVSLLFAKSMGFLGLSSHSLDLLRYPELTAACNEAGLVTFCWGEDNNDEEAVRKLKDMKIHGVLHDSMGKYPENRNNVFKEERLSRSPEVKRRSPTGKAQNTDENIASTNGETSRLDNADVANETAEPSTSS